MATQNVPGAGQSASPSRELNTVPFKTRLRPYLIVAPALLITIGILIPFAMAIYFSLTGYTFRQPIANFVGLRNWIRMFQDDQFWNGVGVTIRYAFWSTLVEMLLGLGIAMLLDTINNRF
ncbi:MAG: hypothetical protein VB065_03145, partial [Eubacteriales bacterium]|nr:hypothetical protein [Eubacteriales bacterium]